MINSTAKIIDPMKDIVNSITNIILLSSKNITPFCIEPKKNPIHIIINDANAMILAKALKIKFIFLYSLYTVAIPDFKLFLNLRLLFRKNLNLCSKYGQLVLLHLFAFLSRDRHPLHAGKLTYDTLLNLFKVMF